MPKFILTKYKLIVTIDNKNKGGKYRTFLILALSVSKYKGLENIDTCNNMGAVTSN